MDKLEEIYDVLLENFGEQEWWPADSNFEVIVGAILTQNTSWKNVEKVINRMKQEEILSMENIIEIKEDKLQQIIRPSGFYRQKARRLKRISKQIYESASSLEDFFEDKNIDELRKELLNIKGIGKETADSIILYSAHKPSFVVDAYTKRIFKRIGMDIGESYNEIKSFLEDNLHEDVEIYKEYHALLVELAKNHCKKKPECKECPLSYLCGYFEKNTIKIKGNKN
ncbi:MAG: endonuclease III domain-containing protein [Candidatus Aenigmatarchaeota archaeon]